MILATPINPGASAAPMARSTLSLRALLLLLVAAVALPLTALAGLAVWHAHQQAHGRAEAEVLGHARTMAAVVDRELQRLQTGLQALADSTALAKHDLDGMEAEMRAMAAQLGGVFIGLTSAAGTQLLSTTWPPGERRPLAAAPPAVASSLATGEVVVTNLITSHNTGRQVVAVVVPVLGRLAEGDAARRAPPTHAFAAAIPEGRLAAALRESAGPGQAPPVATVIDRAGRIVARTRAEAENLGKPIRPAFQARLAGQAEGVLQDAATIEGEPASFAFTRAPRSGFVVSLSLPEVAFTAPLWDSLRRVGLLAAAILAAGAGLAALLAGRIAGALQRLASAAAPERPVLREVDELAHAMAERDQAMARLAGSERRFRALAEAGALVVWRGDSNGAVVDAEGWRTLTGQPDAALRGRGWLAMLHPADRAGAIGGWDAARQAGTPLDIEYRVLTSSGDWRWVRARAVPIAGPDAPTEWVGVVEDVHDRRLAALALEERQERLRLAVVAARLTTWEYDPVADRGNRIGAAEEAVQAPDAPGFSLAEWTAAVHPEDRARTLALLRATLDGEAAAFDAEFRVRRRPPAEGWAWIDSHGAVAERDPVTGAVLRLAGISQDISERRDAEQRRALLAREVDHRAKNVLAVVQSVLRLTRRDQPDSFVATVEARVAALARAHTLLAEQGWTGADLQVLVERELAACPAGTVQLDGPPLAVAAAAVQPLAMVLHELATNAAKHGAASCDGGSVALRWWLEGTRGDGQTLRIGWTERGGPAVRAPPARRGFGSRMMEAIVRGQLGGTLALRWDAAGLDCRITLPAERVLATEAAGALLIG